MYTLIATTLLFIATIVAVLLYFQIKSKRLRNFKNGICPNCNAHPTTFYDKEKNITLSKKPIEAKLLRNNGCSGGVVMQYSCKECDVKEVFNESGSCGL